MVPRGRTAWPWLAGAALVVGAARAEPSSADEMVQLEPVTVTATRRDSVELETPVSVTAVPGAEAARGDIEAIKDLAATVPNASFLEFTARAISNPQFRGVGGSTTNPGVTTYIDGVPQLSADTSSQELIDVGQAEFVRGAQGTLYGRNTLGGVITLSSRRPQPDWTLSAQSGLGQEASRLQRVSLGGPLAGPDAAFALALGTRSRDGYSTNLETGARLDSRDAIFGKAQALAGTERWTFRGIAGVEDADDGDFALYDLAALRAAPFEVRHDYTGFTQRTLQSQTVIASRAGDGVDFRSITGRVRHAAFETTDLDASERNDLVRFNRRHGEQLTQELQWASAADTHGAFIPGLRAGWIGGLFLFRQRSDQDVSNIVTQSGLVRFGRMFLPQGPVGVPPLPIAADAGRLSTPIENIFGADDHQRGELRDHGAGLYGQGELTLGRWQLALGLRYDRERKRAHLVSQTTFDLPGGPRSPDDEVRIDQTRDYAAVSPALRLAWMTDGVMAYAGAGRGYRAGGFNAMSPQGSEAYGAEHSRNVEVGVKAALFEERLSLALAAFDIRLDDLQLNTPIEGGAGRFYIQNAGAAVSRGLELELRALPAAFLEPYLTLGLLEARFEPGSRNLDQDVSGRRLPFADPLRAALGARLRLGGFLLQPEATRFGGYFYDATSAERLEPVTLLALRAEKSLGPVRLEAWGRNLTGRAYIPLAIPYTGIAPSGYVGENAAPRTLGLTLNYDLR